MVVLGNAIHMKTPDSEHSDNPSSSNVIRVDEENHYDEDWIPPFDFRESVRIKTNEKFNDYYELYEEIGEGKFGKVFRCLEKATKLILAAKCIKLKRDADLKKVEKEVTIMTQMRHKCIAQIYDAFATSANEIILIMEIVEGGELFDRVVDENYILTEMAVAMIVYQICEAIRYIHSQNIIHLDLKPENILCLTQTGNQVKLIDFGLAQYFDGEHDLLFMAGTPEFAAPEVIKYEPLDFHTDMWSVGVITYILLSGQSPFLGDNIAVTYCNVERGRWDFCEEFKENFISEEAKDFIKKLLVMDKKERMLPHECLLHPWMVKCREKSRNILNQKREEKPLSIKKLRSYVRNKRFRRLVFGVLFINTVIRMMNTLSERKSVHGIEYVKQMLNAVEKSTQENDNNGVSSELAAKETAAAGLMKSMFFSKRRRNLENEEKLEKVSEPILETIPSIPRRRTTSSGEELHKKPKRLNTARQKPTKVIIDSGTEAGTSSSGAQTDAVKIKRRVKASKTRTASSTEQLLKKPKTEPNGIENEKKETQVGILLDVEAANTRKKEKIKKTKSRSVSPSKLKFLSKFENVVSDTPFLLPVACAPLLSKSKKEEDNKKIASNEDTKNKSEIEAIQILSTKKKRVLKKQNKASEESEKDILKESETNKTLIINNKKEATNKIVIKKGTFLEKESAESSETYTKNSIANKMFQNKTIEPAIIPIAVCGYLPSTRKSSITTEISDIKKSKAKTNEEEGNKNHRKRNELKTSIATLKLKDNSTENEPLTKSLNKNSSSTAKILPLKLESQSIKEERVHVKQKSRKEENEIVKINEHIKNEKLIKNTTKFSTKDNEEVDSKTSKIHQNNNITRRRSRSITSEIFAIPAESSFISDTEEKRDRSGQTKNENKLKTKTEFQLRRGIFENEGSSLFSSQLNLSNDREQIKKCIIEINNNKEILNQKEIKNLNKMAVPINEQKEEISEKTPAKIANITKSEGEPKDDKVKKKIKRVRKVSLKDSQVSLGDLNSTLPNEQDKQQRNAKFPLNKIISNKNKIINDSGHEQTVELLKKEFIEVKPQVKQCQPLQIATENKTNKNLLSDELFNDESYSEEQVQDAFDFSQLRNKLQRRIMGFKDDDELATEAENRQKCESRVQLVDTGSIKRAMKKWISMDKEANPIQFQHSD